ncbi:substrate-binding domain-containing protein [Actinoplanes derwentensis]|uniref:Ribose transport system substrate-binding protein n=1 Tax=Actinoplanes derwentensis TaxID=113562 RepID=A0A1H1YE07_9ACTN|nr:substrate-binding domain-containing protein [Actinoplanes derwentensis]SDT19670.1 ribose transport system substrate-binding protein [Actinoplanes derwentensis]
MRAGPAAFAAAFVLAACSGEAPSEPAPAVLVVAGRQVDFVRELATGFGEGVRRVPGVGQKIIGPETVDNAAEMRMIRGFLDGKHGSISLFTFAPELFADSLGKAAAAGTSLVGLHTIPAPGSRVPLFIGNDNLAIGTQLGEAMAHRIPAQTEGLVIIGSPYPGVVVLDQRASGVRAAVEKLRPDVTVLGPFDTKQDPAANKQAWKTLQEANPHALAFIGVGGADAHSLAELRDTHPTRIDGGVGTDPKALSVAGTGALVLVSTEPYLQGLLAGAIQARCAKDGDELPAGWLAVPGLVVDTVNVGEIVARQASDQARRAWFKPQADAILANLPDHLRPLVEAQ